MKKILAISLLLLLFASINAVACTPSWVVTITATTAEGQTASAQFSGTLDEPSFSQTLATNYALMTVDGVVLGTLDALTLEVNADPFVSLACSGTNSTSSPLTLTASAVVNDFEPIVEGIAYATAGMSLSSGTAAQINGLYPDNKCYKATYNNGTLFSYLMDGYTGVAGQTIIHNDRSPSSGYAILHDVSSLEAAWNFQLMNKGDSGSGSSYFEVVSVPEPMSIFLGILGLTSVAGFGKLRRK